MVEFCCFLNKNIRVQDTFPSIFISFKICECSAFGDSLVSLPMSMCWIIKVMKERDSPSVSVLLILPTVLYICIFAFLLLVYQIIVRH